MRPQRKLGNGSSASDPSGGHLEAEEELSGGAGAEASGIEVGQDLLERGLERGRAGYSGQGADGGGFGHPALVVVAEALTAEGGAAAAAAVRVEEVAPRRCHGEAQVGASEVFGAGARFGRRCHRGVWYGGINSRDSRV